MGKRISILGSTGSIGTQALEVVEKHGFAVHALAAYRSLDLLEQQVRRYQPKMVCIYCEELYHELCQRLCDVQVKVLAGMDGLCEIAADTEADILLNSVVGMVGLKPTLTAIEAGIPIALANKETLVAGGSLVMKAAEEKGVPILPVDSEHSAIFQCLQGNSRKQLHKIILTASGGPFYGKTRDELTQVTAADALKHPNWDMGSKITIDSATLMNKGLEFIEAKWLFDVTPEQIEVVVHRQSVVHSAVEYDDYSVIAQMGVPDMKIPIQYALLYPDRMPCPTGRLSLCDYGQLTFAKPDMETFRCLPLAIDAIRKGGTVPAVMNGANEVAVAAFLQGKIGFLQIAKLVESAMNTVPYKEICTLSDVLEADAAAREAVRLMIK
ncbi:MAG: 1-deoxy-D-xylulose-5-phosphate reductoisomerase [Ruminococcus sp.]|nr:1-deoxy-D-xylulose-5-phosphate reductoisomerase [Ruminococcus sp.]